MKKYTKFTIRTEKPSASDKYAKCYIKNITGGWSPSIYGNPRDEECNVLANCVGYACGRFAEIMNEIDGTEGIKYWEIGKHNACNLITFAQKSGLEIGQVPRPGSIMCYGHADGGYGAQGHVIMIEDVISDEHLVISDSAYRGLPFRKGTATLNKNGTWKIYYETTGVSWSPKGLQGFVYNPSVKEEEPEPTHEFKVGDHIILNGPLYKNATTTTPSGYANNVDTHITRYYAKGIHHYNTTCDLGWCDDSSMTFVEKLVCDIVHKQVEGGTIKTSVDKAKEGDLIFVNVEVQEGYKLDKIYANENEIVDNKFVMPNENVVVKGVFVKDDLSLCGKLVKLILDFFLEVVNIIFGKK